MLMEMLTTTHCGRGAGVGWGANMLMEMLTTTHCGRGAGVGWGGKHADGNADHYSLWEGVGQCGQCADQMAPAVW